ncbi:RNA polymerase II mediator complex subunit [Sorochytrium milnesiophthora]
MPNAQLTALDVSLTKTVETLYKLAETTLDFDDDSQATLDQHIADYLGELAAADQLCQSLDDIYVPVEVIQRVENGENPDVFTKNYMERLAAENQFTNGKIQSLKDFKSILLRQMDEMFPEECDAYKAQRKSASAGTSSSTTPTTTVLSPTLAAATVTAPTAAVDSSNTTPQIP